MRLATFNVNSARRRAPHILRVLERHAPDALFLQELKCRTEEFPHLEFEAAGWQVHAVGQPGGRNGVALITKHPFEVLAESLPGETEDDHARFLAVRLAGLTLAGLYLPNGNSGGEAGLHYKWRWMERLREWTAERLERSESLALLGDFNVCPTAADLAPGALPPLDALVHPGSRARFRALEHLGLTDALRALHPQDAPFTYWDYGAAFESNRGLRIDHALLTADLAERLHSATVDTLARSEDQPSDHAPVIVELG